MNKIILGLALLISSGTSAAEKSNIGIVITYYAFNEFRELCKWKHHGSFTIVDEQFQEWKQENKETIDSAFDGLKKEASKSKVKARKLKNLESRMRSVWGKEYIEMEDKKTAYLCFFKGEAKTYFQLMLAEEL